MLLLSFLYHTLARTNARITKRQHDSATCKIAASGDAGCAHPPGTQLCTAVKAQMYSVLWSQPPACFVQHARAATDTRTTAEAEEVGTERTQQYSASQAAFHPLPAPPPVPTAPAEVWIARLVDERAGVEVDVAPFHGAELCDIRRRARGSAADPTPCSSSTHTSSLLYRGQARAADALTPSAGWQGRAQVCACLLQ